MFSHNPSNKSRILLKPFTGARIAWAHCSREPIRPKHLLPILKTQANGGESFKKEIVLPKYVKNVAKVQIWCSFAEVNLAEASFSSPVM